jgi:O-antigen/teichoic acid export membrane protein
LLKKLASQTAIYGIPTIVGRFLNYLLNPLFAYSFSTTEMGIVGSAFAYVSFLQILVTYGMETALFRFSQTEDKDKVYTTALISVLVSSAAFIFFMTVFSSPISGYIKFNGHPEYVTWFSIILGADALSAIAFAKLREQNRPKMFAFIKTLNLAINIGLNLFFILFCKRIYEGGDSVFKPFVSHIYNPNIGVGYIFISILVSSLATLLLLLPQIIKIKLTFDKPLWKKMIRYSSPLIIAGLAGMANDTLDRVLLTWLIPGKSGLSQVGIYTSCYKVSIIMVLFIQTFRFAAEPFFFSQFKEKDSKLMYADIMKYFVIVCSVIFLGTMMNIHWIQYFAGSAEFRTGIKVVPILLLANLFLGIFYNQSIWYKLTGQTRYGAFLTIFGALITIVLNIYWIPRIGYMGCAWATLICYVSMTVASYFMGNKHYPVNYDLKRILGYLALSVTLYALSIFIKTDSIAIKLVINNLFVIAFVAVVWKFEKHNFRSIA